MAMEVTEIMEQIEREYRIWPVTICAVRYTGVYEGGLWAAFAAYPWDVPEDAFADDMTCAEWWRQHRAEVGVGNTVQEAHDALKRAYVRGTMKDFSERS